MNEDADNSLVNLCKTLRDDDNFFIRMPFSHESSVDVINSFKEELLPQEVPDWFNSCLSEEGCSFFNMMYFTYKASLYYILVRSEVVKQQLKEYLNIDHPVFIVGIGVPKTDWEKAAVAKVGATHLHEERWIVSNNTFPWHGKNKNVRSDFDKELVDILNINQSFFSYQPIQQTQLAAHQKASAKVAESYSKGDLNLSSRPVDPSSIKAGSTISGDLRVNFTNLDLLPENLTIEGDLYAQNSSLERLPKNLKVGGKINLNKTNLSELPENFEVGGSLQLSECKIKKIPKGLKVKGNLTLSSSLVEEISSDVEALSLYLKGTPLAKKIVEQNLNVEELFPNVNPNNIYLS
jgi:hypothetical protein